MVEAAAGRIKVMAGLDIAEKRLPQDGRIALRIAGRPVDVRVSTLPTGHGERVVLRLLDKSANRLELERLGMRREGHLIRNIWFKRDEYGAPVWADTYEYAILAEEWHNPVNT